ncbi:MAG: permease-like cell division protein FtsX [Clostridia bacterium]|nr:permease-like cell division protein FtsX [Clostridia bacterium]MBQ2326330.1 permease-like cell division protein FtsX [Clostridia bacterium]
MITTKIKNLNIGYFIKEGLVGIKQHGLMSFAAVTVIAACLLIVSTFGLIAYNIDLLIDGLASQNEIAVFVDEALSREEAQALQQAFDAISNVEEVTFITKEQAFDNYLETMGEDAYIMEDLREDNPLRDEYRIVMKDVSLHDETVEQLKAVSGVASTNSEKEISDRLMQMKSIVNAVSYTLIALLGAVSIFIISNTVRLAMFARREEISIMKMVGATDGFIRAPFVIEGMTLGLLAGLVSFGVEWVVYDYITEKLVESSGLFSMIAFEEIWRMMLPLMLGASVVIGILGSVLTIRKFLRV